MKVCGDVFVSDWFQFVINIHDYLWNLRQTKHLIIVFGSCEDVSLRVPGNVAGIWPCSSFEEDKVERDKSIKMLTVSVGFNLLVSLLFFSLRLAPGKLKTVTTCSRFTRALITTCPVYTAVSTKVVPQKRTRQCRLVLWVERFWL